MRKLTLSMFAVLCILVLAACGNNNSGGNANNNGNNNQNEPEVEETENNNEEANNDETDENADVDGDVEEIFKKTMEANNDIESVSATSDMKQTMTMSGEEQEVDSTTEMDMIMDPLSMKQIITMDMPGQGEQKTEMYMTEDGFYMFEPTEEVWIKLPEEMSGQMTAQMEAQMNIEAQMEQFEAMLEYFSLEEEDDVYVLKFEAEDDVISEQVQDVIENSLPEDMAALGQEALQNMTINHIDYEMIIDKDTYYPETFNMSLDFDMEIEGETMNSVQDMTMTYTDFNKVDSIVVPEEALENAEEMEM